MLLVPGTYHKKSSVWDGEYYCSYQMTVAGRGCLWELTMDLLMCDRGCTVLCVPLKTCRSLKWKVYKYDLPYTSL